MSRAAPTLGLTNVPDAQFGPPDRRLGWACAGLLMGSLIQGLAATAAATIDFEDLVLAAESHWNGPDPDGEIRPAPLGGTEVVGGFLSGGGYFVNRYNLDYDSWSGFAYSNRTDASTPGAGNQFSAVTGSGYPPGQDIYAIAFGDAPFLDPRDPMQRMELPYVDLPPGWALQSLRVTNTSYAAFSMRQGDAFAKRFGGATGSDPDWFKISAWGTNAAGELLPAAAEFYLADFQSPDPDEDYIVDQWMLWEASALSAARRVYFNLTSSDTGAFGMNTPAYFAIDQLQLVALPPGDFNGDGGWNCQDLDQLVAAIAQGAWWGPFDLTGDGQVDGDDLGRWLALAGAQNLPSGQPYRPGDANLDGAVDVSDFNLWNGHRFLERPSWCAGDFNADGQIDVSDFNLWNQFRFTAAARGQPVPEPTGGAALLIVFAPFVVRIRLG